MELGRTKQSIPAQELKSLYVMKFGGTSVGGARPIERVTAIIDSYQKQVDLVVVISALRGVTNKLVSICDSLNRGREAEAGLSLEDVLYQHSEVINNLGLSSSLRYSLEDDVTNLFLDLRDYSFRHVRRINPPDRDRILSYGERFSVRIVAAKLIDKGVMVRAVDANEIIETDSSYGEAKIDMVKSAKYAKYELGQIKEQGGIPIVTGFIGSNKRNRITTLGRGGSDYTATILGNVLGADEVWIWTDVDGVYTQDPRYYPGATVYAQMSQVLAHKMAMEGAKVLYPKTIEPLLGTDVILRVKNTFNPYAEGTRISHG